MVLSTVTQKAVPVKGEASLPVIICILKHIRFQKTLSKIETPTLKPCTMMTADILRYIFALSHILNLYCCLAISENVPTAAISGTNHNVSQVPQADIEPLLNWDSQFKSTAIGLKTRLA